MSTRNIYDNWERLVLAVVKREDYLQMCHDHSRNTSISSSISSDFGSSSPLSDEESEIQITASRIYGEQMEVYESGVNITIRSLRDGTKEVIRARFSRRYFTEQEADNWWRDNKFKVYERYNAWGGIASGQKDELFGKGNECTEEEYEPGVWITRGGTLKDGNGEIKRVRFSKTIFKEDEAEAWWVKNRKQVYKKYNARLTQ